MPLPSLRSAPSVLVVMAVFNPKPAHLRQQMTSLAAQSTGAPALMAVIADTRSGALVSELASETGLAVTLVEPRVELDPVRAFEAGLKEALLWTDAQQISENSQAPLIALSDQDDIWHPDRLSRGISTMAKTGAALVHSDARLVDDAGQEAHRSMFAFERRDKKPGLRGLLLRNNITGMTVLMRPDVLRIALPFPAQSGLHYYHDLWLGLVAHVLEGGVALIPEPLVDYRQHNNNAIGAVDRSTGTRKRRRPDAMWLRQKAASYALARYLAQCLRTRITDTLPEALPRLRPLRPFLRHVRGASTHLFDALRLLVTGHFQLARIAASFALVNAGRLVWSLRDGLRKGLNDSVLELDNKLYSLSPGVAPPVLVTDKPQNPKPMALEEVIDQRKAPRWTPVFDAADPALTILVPTLNPAEIFAGVVTALDIGVKLAEQGLDVRFIATDLPVSSPDASWQFLLQRLGHRATSTGAKARLSLACGVRSPEISAHKDDVFLATAWWTAHVADHLIAAYGFGRQKFLYLIQDFEPNFYAWGQPFADATASYGLSFDPIFNTSLLRDYFADQGFGCATPDALTFQPSIDISRYREGRRPTRNGPRKLALYGRPEVERNMYPTAVEALSMFIHAEGLGPQDIEVVSVGLRHRPVTLSGDVVLKSLGKLPWDDYPDFLLNTDLGLSLMYSPHPSHPPIEMAASGMRVVTNRFGPKDLSLLSPAILSAAPTVPALARALSQAWHAPPVSNAERDIALSSLGLPLPDVIDRLVVRLSPLIKSTS